MKRRLFGEFSCDSRFRDIWTSRHSWAFVLSTWCSECSFSSFTHTKKIRLTKGERAWRTGEVGSEKLHVEDVLSHQRVHKQKTPTSGAAVVSGLLTDMRWKPACICHTRISSCKNIAVSDFLGKILRKWLVRTSMHWLFRGSTCVARLATVHKLRKEWGGKVSRK